MQRAAQSAAANDSGCPVIDAANGVKPAVRSRNGGFRWFGSPEMKLSYEAAIRSSIASLSALTSVKSQVER